HDHRARARRRHQLRRRNHPPGPALFLAPAQAARALRAMTRIVTRPVPIAAAAMLQQAGVHPVLARLYAARGIRSAAELGDDFAALLPPTTLTHAEAAAALLADHIAAGKRMLVIADFDCDGATACAVMLRALRAFGARVDYFVP